MSEDERCLTAYHEAGHAVACYTCHMAFTKVSIVPEQAKRSGSQTLGYCRLATPANLLRPRRAQLEKHIMVLWAGSIASRYAEGRTPDDDRDGVLAGPHGSDDFEIGCGAQRDVEMIDNLALAIARTNEEGLALTDWLRVRIRDVILRPQRWAAVEALAQELLRRETVGYRRARAVIAAALPSPDADYRLPDRADLRCWLEQPSRKRQFCQDLAPFLDIASLDQALEGVPGFMNEWCYPLYEALLDNTDLDEDACGAIARHALLGTTCTATVMGSHAQHEAGCSHEGHPFTCVLASIPTEAVYHLGDLADTHGAYASAVARDAAAVLLDTCKEAVCARRN